MKIDGVIPFPDLQPQAPKRSSAGNTAGPSDAGAAVTEGASASTSNLVGKLANRLAELPAVRQERVAALRKAVQNGEYAVTDQQIADALHSQLLAKPPSGN